MTADHFRAWLREMDISAAEAARQLGVHPNTVTHYKAKGAPLAVALACAALYHRLRPWPPR